MFKINIAEKKVEATEKLSSKVSFIKIGNQGDLVAVGLGNGTVAFYRISEAKMVSTSLKYHTNFVTSLSFNDDDTRCYSTSYDHTIYVWNTEKFSKSDKIVTTHKGALHQLLKTEDGFVSIGSDACIQKWAYGQ